MMRAVGSAAGQRRACASPGVLPRHIVGRSAQPRCVAPHGLRVRDRPDAIVSAAALRGPPGTRGTSEAAREPDCSVSREGAPWLARPWRATEPAAARPATRGSRTRAAAASRSPPPARAREGASGSLQGSGTGSTHVTTRRAQVRRRSLQRPGRPALSSARQPWSSSQGRPRLVVAPVTRRF
jgi:hypothetical protein